MGHDGGINAPRGPHVDVFNASGMAQSGEPEPCGRLPRVAFSRLAVNRQSRPFLKAEAFERGARAAVFVQRLEHAGQADGLQAV